MKKIYSEPKFELVKADETTKLFFAASGALGGPTGSINSFTSTPGEW